jgi:hypothetical protein
VGPLHIGAARRLAALPEREFDLDGALPGTAFVPRLARTPPESSQRQFGCSNDVDYSTKQASPTGFESGGSERQGLLLSRLGPIDHTPDPADCDLTRANATPDRRNEPKPELELESVVEPALARALVLAAEAGRWAIVEQIARALKVRRERWGTRARTATGIHRSSA